MTLILRSYSNFYLRIALKKFNFIDKGKFRRIEKLLKNICKIESDEAITKLSEACPDSNSIAVADEEVMCMQHCTVLDLGTGNGHFLFELAGRGFKQLYGVDYSQAAISLARTIAEQNGCHITFAKLDLVAPDLENTSITKRRYDVLHDKGTYDAISLTPDTATIDRERYLANVARLLDSDGVFVITSCNWTQEELLHQTKKYFTMEDSIPTPSFNFGGKTGNLVTALILKVKIS